MPEVHWAPESLAVQSLNDLVTVYAHPPVLFPFLCHCFLKEVPPPLQTDGPIPNLYGREIPFKYLPSFGLEVCSIICQQKGEWAGMGTGLERECQACRYSMMSLTWLLAIQATLVRAQRENMKLKAEVQPSPVQCKLCLYSNSRCPTPLAWPSCRQSGLHNPRPDRHRV